MSSGCSRNLLQTQIPMKWFLDNLVTHDKGKCTERVGDYYRFCSRTDAQHVWGVLECLFVWKAPIRRLPLHHALYARWASTRKRRARARARCARRVSTKLRWGRRRACHMLPTHAPHPVAPSASATQAMPATVAPGAVRASSVQMSLLSIVKPLEPSRTYYSVLDTTIGEFGECVGPLNITVMGDILRSMLDSPP